MAAYIDWPGKSGKTYRYWFVEKPTADGLLAAGGNYVFVKRLSDGTFAPIYFGEGDDLKVRIPNHERWSDALQAGMTHVMAHTTPAGEQARLDEEADLIAHWNPPLNAQGRTGKPKVSVR